MSSFMAVHLLAARRGQITLPSFDLADRKKGEAAETSGQAIRTPSLHGRLKDMFERWQSNSPAKRARTATGTLRKIRVELHLQVIRAVTMQKRDPLQESLTPGHDAVIHP
jgi:hypothetical protein